MRHLLILALFALAACQNTATQPKLWQKPDGFVQVGPPVEDYRPKGGSQ